MSFERNVTAEIMDQPGLPAEAHREALAGLRRINQASKVCRTMLAPIAEAARRWKAPKLQLLDIACGGGDVPVAVAQAAKEINLDIELTLLDRSDTALTEAADAARRAGIVCRTVQGDVTEGLPAGRFDVVTNSLFLHHRPDRAAASDFFRKIVALSPRLAVISDLQRCRMGWWAAWFVCRLLTRSRIVHADGPASVAAAWTIREIRELAAGAGMKEAQIRSCWPWRMLLVWENGK